jgi:hypothetical protein
MMKRRSQNEGGDASSWASPKKQKGESARILAVSSLQGRSYQVELEVYTGGQLKTFPRLHSGFVLSRYYLHIRLVSAVPRRDFLSRVTASRGRKPVDPADIPKNPNSQDMAKEEL